MALDIRQGFKYEGDDWWRWWLWVEGPDDELDEIDRVVYTLHPTFPQPVRTVRDRSSKFRLETAGWGVFTIYIRIVHKDRSETLLDHDLELWYPGGKPGMA